ncbi:14-3-3 superfamily protein, partial [Cardiosporidium cionae]
CSGFKSAMQQRRFAMNQLENEEKKLLEQEDSPMQSLQLYHLKQYKKNIFDEMLRLWTESNTVLDQVMSTAENNAEIIVYCHLFKGDCARYCAMVADDEEEKNVFIQHSIDAYKCGMKEAESGLISLAKALRLGLLLNYAVLLKHLVQDNKQAIDIGCKAFKDAISHMYEIEKDDEYRETLVVLGYLKEDVQGWCAEDGLTKKEINELFGIEEDDSESDASTLISKTFYQR